MELERVLMRVVGSYFAKCSPHCYSHLRHSILSLLAATFLG